MTRIEEERDDEIYVTGVKTQWVGQNYNSDLHLFTAEGYDYYGFGEKSNVFLGVYNAHVSRHGDLSGTGDLRAVMSPDDALTLAAALVLMANKAREDNGGS